MVSKTIKITMEQGFHLRPAGVLSKEMEEFSSDVRIIFGDKKINAKSLINIISAAMKKGDEVTFECDGDDEEEALAKVLELASQNFKD